MAIVRTEATWVAVLAALSLGIGASRAPAQDGADADLLAQGCMACHGAGWTGEGAMPSLEALAAADIAQALRDFRAGTSEATIMQRLALGLGDSQIDALEVYFSNLRH